jgi:hypothetical protein
MAPAVKELERAILAHEMHHGGHPVLRWNLSNVQIETDKAGNRTMHKGKSGNKIDGAVACATAVSRASMAGEASVYDADWYKEELDGRRSEDQPTTSSPDCAKSSRPGMDALGPPCKSPSRRRSTYLPSGQLAPADETDPNARAPGRP